LLLSGLLVVSSASIANAAPATLGDVLENAVASFEEVPQIIILIAYLAGLFLAVWALIKFKEHVDHPHQVPISDPVKKFIAGGCFLALPMVLQASLETFWGVGGVGTFNHDFSAPDDLAAVAAGPADSLDEVAVAFIRNITGPFGMLLTAFVYIAGLSFILIGISRLTKTMQEGPRGPAGVGTLMTFVAGTALLSYGDAMGAFATSMFGSDTSLTNVEYTGPLTLGASEDQVMATIEALMIFIMLVGYIAFVRGWFVLKAFADGAQGVSLAQGLTFLFGGAIAANLGNLLNTLEGTFGYAVLGFTFS